MESTSQNKVEMTHRSSTFKKPIPQMWFDKFEGFDRIGNFNKYKKDALSRSSGVTQFGRVDLGNFFGMLRYFKDAIPNYAKLKIYIAMYSDETRPGVPTNFGKQLTLIFSPADEDGRGISSNIYYVIPPGESFDENDVEHSQIDHDRLTEWKENYFRNMPFDTIDSDNPENICKGCTYDKAMDTIAVFYRESALYELIEEQEYPHRDITNTRDIELSKDCTVFFTSQNINPMTRPNFRITLDFEFTIWPFTPVYLEDTYGFKQRQVLRLTGVDNGQLCPTYCP
jgi:hypothetical protein